MTDETALDTAPHPLRPRIVRQRAYAMADKTWALLEEIEGEWEADLGIGGPEEQEARQRLLDALALAVKANAHALHAAQYETRRPA